MSFARDAKPARLVETLRGEAMLLTSGRRIPVRAEISEYQVDARHWRTGWIAGDLVGLEPADGPLESQLVFAGRPALKGALDDLDATGATFEQA